MGREILVQIVGVVDEEGTWNVGHITNIKEAVKTPQTI